MSVKQPAIRVAESVTIGHPDKLADRIADALLDAYIQQDPYARTAFEVFLCGQHVVLGGEVTSKAAIIDHADVVRRVLADTGYTEAYYNCRSISIQDLTRPQHAEIQAAVGQGAGDQGVMVGYAEAGHASYLPLPLVAARNITQELTRLGPELGLRPDGKSLVTVTGQEADVLVSTQHRVGLDSTRAAVREHVILPVLDDLGLTARAIRVNPAGEFLIGGPVADTGLTGRKLAVDTYGGLAGHGGGAFSGKDPSKVDRSAAYMARRQARSLVQHGLCDRVEIRVAYGIGDTQATLVSANTFGTGEELDIGESGFNPAGIADILDLRKPIYERACVLGHFGHPDFPWEATQ